MITLRTTPDKENEMITKLRMKGYTMIDVNPKDAKEAAKAEVVVITDALPEAKIEVTHATVDAVPDKKKNDEDGNGKKEETAPEVAQIKETLKKLPDVSVTKTHIGESLKNPNDPVKLADPDESDEKSNSRFNNNLMNRGIGW